MLEVNYVIDCIDLIDKYNIYLVYIEYIFVLVGFGIFIKIEY